MIVPVPKYLTLPIAAKATTPKAVHGYCAVVPEGIDLMELEVYSAVSDSHG